MVSNRSATQDRVQEWNSPVPPPLYPSGGRHPFRAGPNPISALDKDPGVQI